MLSVFICEHNIKQFKVQLLETRPEEQKATLRELLVEEEERLMVLNEEERLLVLNQLRPSTPYPVRI
ncbi:MAG: hypothetical protein P4M09_28795 [Devosia sp.]|nr:hypothetical protein [Devosia sp.]